MNTASSDKQETSVIIANSAETAIIPDVINTEVTSEPGGSVINLYVNSKTQILLQTAGRVFLEQIIRTTK